MWKRKLYFCAQESTGSRFHLLQSNVVNLNSPTTRAADWKLLSHKTGSLHQPRVGVSAPRHLPISVCLIWLCFVSEAFKLFGVVSVLSPLAHISITQQDAVVRSYFTRGWFLRFYFSSCMWTSIVKFIEITKRRKIKSLDFTKLPESPLAWLNLTQYSAELQSDNSTLQVRLP